MDIKNFIIAIAMLIGGVFSIATSSIATKCYNESADFKESNKTSFNFIVVNLVSAILVILSASFGIYFASTM